MALPTYLELINNVLVRMRQAEVTDIANNVYATMIGAFVNDAKRQVEDAHDWSAYLTDYQFNTVASQSKYSIVGSENRVKIDAVVNTTTPGEITEVPRAWLKRQRDFTVGSGDSAPSYYANEGTDSNGDAIISLWPLPDGVYTVEVTGWQRAADLSAISDTLAIPANPVFDLALGYAVRERGEVGGTSAAEFFELAKRSLADAISYDSARNEDDDNWYFV